MIRIKLISIKNPFHFIRFFSFLLNHSRISAIIYLCLLLAIGLTSASAQSNNQPKWNGIRPSGKFLTDSIKLGYPVQYALSLRHPEDMEVIFPDSSYNYAPFQWQTKQYFPTQTGSAGSLDSVVYTLISFELDSLQTLTLPVFIITRQDCTAVFAQPDTIFFQSLLASRADSLDVKINVTYMPVQTHFNIGYVLIGMAATLVLALVIYVFFGKKLARQYRLYTISREHTSFKSAYDRMVKNIEASSAVGHVENAVILWKNYMEQLEDKPFSTYTTKEIIELIPNEQLAEALQHTDKVIYGQMTSAESVRYTRILAYIARRAYIEKRVSIEKQKV